MNITDIAQRGLVILGCGKMGSALLEGWLAGGLDPRAVWVVEPRPSGWLEGQGVRLNEALPKGVAVVLLAVKPQMMADALPQVRAAVAGDTLVISIAAGTPLAAFEAEFGAATPIVRAMPNTPAAVGRGISALVGNAAAGPDHLELAEGLMGAVGATVSLQDEDQINVVTALSGGGPAYVFHMIEAMAAAGVEQGLAPELSMQLARATVCGAGELAQRSNETAEQLRVNVTSPGGTTAAALRHLMDADTGLPPLMARAVAAATARARELAG